MGHLPNRLHRRILLLWLACATMAWAAEGESFFSPTSFIQGEGPPVIEREVVEQPGEYPESLVESLATPDAEDLLPAPAESESQPPTGRPGWRTWPGGKEIEGTMEKLPEFLPEGMVPPITGPTREGHRHYAVGQPLQGTSWLASSHSAGMFLGTIGGTTMIDRQLEQGAGAMFGLRFGIDYDYRWGLEKRFGFAQMDVFDVRHHQRQIINLELGDVDLLFYPWGDTRWRPYMSTGAGLAHFNYESESGRRIDRLLVGLPFGIGLKYFWSEGVDVRMELVDNLMLGAHELSTMNNLSLTVGVEFRYSGFHLAGRQTQSTHGHGG